jgi:hypothetical protein
MIIMKLFIMYKAGCIYYNLTLPDSLSRSPSL